MSKAKNKTGFREKIKEIRRTIGAVNYEIGWYFDLIEKIFKVFTWQYPSTSNLFLILLIMLWIVVSFIPIRTFVAIGILAKFKKESKFF